MATATNFNTSNSTFRKLMGNGLTYRVPAFQRDYSWGQDEWEDLWLDILGTLDPAGESAHYMGYLVLQSEDDKNFEIIDGQQRLTTLSILVLAVLKNLDRLVHDAVDADNNSRRRDQIRQAYIGYLDPITLNPRSKLTLNRNNDRYYQTYLVPLASLPLRGFKASEHSLRRAFEWFDDQLGKYVAQQAEDRGVALARFVETVSDRLFFTVITVTDELNAYKVFETLNARGVRLSSTDLLKNYLFSVLHRGGQHEHDLRVLDDRWETLVGRLGSESLPDFLRVHWNSRHALVRQTELFKTIRSKVIDRPAVFALVREMEEDVDTYLALSEPDGSPWPKPLINDAGLLRTFSVKQPFPMLLAAHRMLPESDFGRLLRASVVISLRYNVIGSYSPADQERAYASATAALVAGLARNASDMIHRLAAMYPSDDVFRAAFAEKSIRTTQPRNRRVVKYLLCQIEKHLSQADYDMDSDTFNVEHIFPQHPESGWEGFPENTAETYHNRLGNMTLLGASANRDLGHADWPEKRAAYRQSEFAITRRLAEENVEWNRDRVDARQRWMAHQATSIWRIDQLS